MSMARRLYINGVSLVSLPIMLGGGSVLLVAIIRRMGIGTGYNTDSDIAIAATLLLIGLPIWAIHHRLGQRTVRNNPDEAGSLFRAIYIYGALLITGLAVAIEAILAVSYDQDQFATILVFGSFWMYFLFLEHGEARPTSRTVIARQLYFYTMSASLLCLAMSAFFLGVYGGLTPWNSDYEATGILDNAQHLFSAIFPPGVAWAAHWLLFARRNTGSIARHIYLYFFGITGGVLIASWNAAKLIQLTFDYWVLGQSWSYTLDWMPLRSFPLHHVLRNFAAEATSPLVFLIVGLALVAFHWPIVRSDKRSGVEAGAAKVRDISRHALAALSLAALPFGMYLLLVAAKQETYGLDISLIYREPRWYLASNLTGLIAFALVGAFLWLVVWPRIGFTYRTNGSVRFARIAYFGSVLIVSGSAVCLSLALVVGAVALVVFDHHREPPAYIYDSPTAALLGVPTAILVISALLLAYHLRTLRNERHSAHPATPSPDPLPH